MRNSVYAFLVLASLSFAFTSNLSAADQDTGFDFNDFSAENIKASENDSPFSFTIEADFIGQSKLKNSHFKGDKFEYRYAEAEAGAVFYYNPTYKEGLSLILNYSPTWLDWKNNPWFDQKEFHIVSLGIGGVTERVRNWIWRGEVDILTDANEFQGGFRYVFYNMLGWGRYTVNKCVGLHFGLIAEVGMRTDRVYPILGFDWQISRSWKLNAVAPVNVSLEYTLNKHWAFALAGRTISFRSRVARHQCSRRSIVRFDSVGAELAATYKMGHAEAGLHAGTTLGSRLRIASPSNHHPRHYKIGAAPYVGGTASIKF